MRWKLSLFIHICNSCAILIIIIDMFFFICLSNNYFFYFSVKLKNLTKILKIYLTMIYL